MSGTKFLFKWRSRVLSGDGPESPITRYVLLAISTYMDTDGESCFPSIATMATDTGLTEKTVGTHLKLGVDDGWLRRWKKATGKGWKLYHYEANLPDGPVTRTPPNEYGPVRGTGASKSGQVSDAVGPVSDGNMVRYDVPTTSSYNSSKISPRAVTERARRRSVPLGHIKELERRFGLRETRAMRVAIDYVEDAGDPDDLDGLVEYARGKES